MEDVNTGSKEIDEIDEALKEFATQRRKGPLATMASSSEKIQQYPTFAYSGHQCSHAPGRPILHLVSSSLVDLGV
jgi:hypothetical protein